MITSEITYLRPFAAGVPPGGVFPAGPAGASAYALWLAAGNTGTLTDYLASLVGPSGPIGPSGPTTISGLTDASTAFKALNVASSALQRQALGAAAAADLDALTQTVGGKAGLGVNGDITGLTALTQAKITGASQIVVPFAASPGVTFQSSLALAVASAFETEMEFGLAVNLTATKGASNWGKTDGTSYKGAKVAIFGGVDVQPGGGQGYALNTASIFRSGVGIQPMLGAEFNVNNYNMHVGDLDGDVAGGTFSPPAYYLLLTGGGTYRMTAAFCVDLAQADASVANSVGTKVNRGILGFNGTIPKSWIEDATNARESYLMRNTKTAAGFDLRQASILTQLALALAAPHTLSWRNAANTADLKLIGKDTSDYLLLGGGVASTRMQPAAGSNLLVRGVIDFFSGVTLQSVNDAGTALSNLEILAASAFWNAAMYVPKTLAAGGAPVQVSAGAADSGGTGYKVLRIPNN